MSRSLPSLPALSDLSTDIANGIPPELVLAWADGERSEARAAELLAPYRRIGTVATSDTVGLSRMTKEHDLSVVLQMISRPKEILHALGTEIGGEAIGRWVADNTEMFYNASIPVDEVVGAMLEVHRRLPPGSPKIGIGIHYGTFYHIGGGLYGMDADLVEHIAEEESRGGETLLTGAAHARLRAAASYPVEVRDDLAAFGPILHVTDGPSYAHLPLRNTKYPAPYSNDFHDAIERMEAKTAEGLDEAMTAYSHEKAVLLVERCPTSENISGLVGLLNELLGNALLNLTFRQQLRPYETVCKTAGHIVLATFDEVGQALAVAQALRAAMADNGFILRAGIDVGPLLIFPMGNGRWEFAGDPVNIASKQAEDCGMPGWIYLSEQAAVGLDLPDAEPFEWQRSALTIRSVGLRPQTE
ncbi:MAG: hypothetical protein H0T73_18600 [Ardenticatenales bacterium]|nr:hypothetical protein [Ardenticatenales bacterium]